MPLVLARSTFSLEKRVLLSGLFVGSLEPCIESSILFSAAGLVNTSHMLFLIWIGAIELWGVGQFLLLLSNFKEGERLRAAVLLWFTLSPAVFLFFAVGNLLSPYIHFLKVWGPLTVGLVAVLIAGLPARIPKTKIPLAYVSLLAGISLDATVSLFFFNSPVSVVVRNSIIPSTFYIDAFFGLTILGTSFLADKMRFHNDRKANYSLRMTTFLYLVTTAGFLAGIFPPYLPVLVLSLGFVLAVFLRIAARARSFS